MAKVNLLDSANQLYDNSLSGLTSINVQDAIDEIKLTVENKKVRSILELDIADGLAGQFLTTDGAGTFDFTSSIPTITIGDNWTITDGDTIDHLHIFDANYVPGAVDKKHIIFGVEPDGNKHYETFFGFGTDAPGQKMHIADGNMLFEGFLETGMMFKRGDTLTGDLIGGGSHPSAPFVNPLFTVGRIIQGGDGAPQFRWMYQDDGRAEHVVMELDSEGIMSSVRQAGSQERGSHFEAHTEGHEQPYFRLNSWPHMQLQMGHGNSDATDVAIGRSAAETLDIRVGAGVAEEVITTFNKTNVTVSKPVVATSFSGDGSLLTNLPFSELTDKPTTIAGYGITDGVQEGDSVTLTGDVTGTANFDSNGDVSITTVVGNDTHTHSFDNITGKPTTIAGYGITDAFDGTYSSLSGAPSGLTDLSINDGTNGQILTTDGAGTFTFQDAPQGFDGLFSSLSSTPTTLAGYGITDAFDGAFSSLTGKPTTLAGYGITDSASSSVTRADTSNTSAPAAGNTFTVVDSVTTNGAGQVTAINVKTVTMPSLTIYDVNNNVIANV